MVKAAVATVGGHERLVCSKTGENLKGNMTSENVAPQLYHLISFIEQS